MRKLKLKRLFSSLFLFIIITTLSLQAATNFPSPTPYFYINDYVSITNQSARDQIISIGHELEAKTGAEATIVIIDSTDTIPLEDYANELFRTWGIGSANQDNGLLILMSMSDTTWRIEVGRGLEGALPDLLTNKVMTEIAKPHFVNGDYSQGLVLAYSSFADSIAAEYGVTLDHSLHVAPVNASPTSHYGGIMGIVLMVVVALDLVFNRGRIFGSFLQLLFISNLFRGGPRGGRGGGGGFGGSGFGGGGFGGGSSNGGGSSGGW